MNNYNDLPSFEINFKDYIRGQNSFNEYPDGGIKTESIGANPFYVRGYLSTSPDQTNINAIDGDGDNDIAVLAYGQGVGVNTLVACAAEDATNSGLFYTIDPNGVYTLVGSPDAAHNYVKGNTDSAFYHSHFYFTSTQDLARMDDDLTSPDFSYWTGTLGQSNFTSFKHPLLVFGDILYIGDGQYLHQIDDTTPQEQVLDLEEGYIVDCLITYNNLMFIAAHQGNGFSKIYTWDGFSPSWLDEYEVNDTISCLFVFQGVLFVFFDDAIGYFDGTKVKQIREIAGTVQKHMVTKSRTAMYFIETFGGGNLGRSCLTRYSPVIFQGSQVNTFIRYLDQFALTNENNRYVTCVISRNQNLFTSTVNNAADTASSGEIDGDKIQLPSDVKTYEFVFNDRNFNSQVQIRQVIAQFADVDEDNTIALSYIDDSNTQRVIGTVSGSNADVTARESFKDTLQYPATQRVTPVVAIEKHARLFKVRFYYEGVEEQVPSGTQ